MEYIRFIHPKYYDRRTADFKSLAFRTSSNGGASILELPCVRRESVTICNHARKHYESKTTGDPPVFLQFGNALLLQGSVIKHSRSNGDICHYEVFHSNKRRLDKNLKKILKNTNPRDLNICRNGEHRRVTNMDLLRFEAIAAAYAAA